MTYEIIAILLFAAVLCACLAYIQRTEPTPKRRSRGSAGIVDGEDNV